MCGIFAAIDNNSVTNHLLHGLSSLSYRGYDSAGIAVMQDGILSRARCEGKLEKLEEHLSTHPIDGGLGIAHTRWATHGLPNERNAHPHMTPRVAVVHNGIVENANTLKTFLEDEGYHFDSETDSESIAQLITYYLNKGHEEEAALQAALDQIDGSYGIVVMFNNNKNCLYASKQASPLVVGKSKTGLFISSDENALADLASHVLHLNDGEIVKLNAASVTLKTDEGIEIIREFTKLVNDKENAQKGEYNHYMLKEIHEQPAVFDRCWHNYFNKETNEFNTPTLRLPLNHISRLTIIACGTSYFAGMVAKQWLETHCATPVDLEIASEYRYRNAPVVANSVAVFISQSGETADTLAALKHAKSMGQTTLALVNVINSTMAHEADLALPTLAGPEIGVASTKAFISQLTILLTLSIAFGKANKTLTRRKELELIDDMHQFSNRLEQSISNLNSIKAAAELLKDKTNALFIGRGIACALAEEGALKLKEISYIHAEAYAAGELKHGPLALVDEKMPVIVIAPPDNFVGKTLSNLREVASRGGKIILISSKAYIDEYQEHISLGIEIPEVHTFLQPMLYSIPLQLIAYHTAILRGNNVDQPRNLAKSVTVE